MRNTFIKTLTNLARKNKNIYLLTGDLGFMVFENFKREFKERFINMGVSEANMIGVAAGLALSGKIVFVYSIIPFVTYRCLEHIRNDICFHNLNVKIIGVGSGYSYGIMGDSHHALEDIGVMSSLPKMTVICPGDPWEVKSAINSSLKYKSPLYIRLAKTGEPILHNKKTIAQFKVGKGIIIQQGSDCTIIATGNMLETALKVAENLQKVNYTSRIVSMHTVKPVDVDLINNCAEETKYIFTLEEHYLNNGLGSIVANELKSKKINYCIHSFGAAENLLHNIGTLEYLRAKTNLSVPQITKKIINILSKEKQ